MRRLIGTTSGVRLVRSPWPAVEPGCLLVRVEASLISAGTELAPYRDLAREREKPPLARLAGKAAVAIRYAHLAARHPDKAAARLSRIARGMIAPISQGTVEGPSDYGDQGWSLGYSAAGRVLAAGPGVTGYSPGDLVACAGAGIANHADIISVPVNLACKAPGLPSKQAAFATVGAIALQGIRRAKPELGETVAVIGLGLLGILTVQMLVAAGCSVIGFDLDQRRVERATGFGLALGSSDEAEFRAMICDATTGWGADKVLICAATPSDRPVNLAMNAIRRKGCVVVVGDVGLKVDRVDFYKKEADLLISTSYGPGRYDPDYENRGIDYPLPYVRWSLNRNMSSFLQLARDGRISLAPMIDREIPIDQAGPAYVSLTEESGPPTLGVLLIYDECAQAELGSGGEIGLRGACRPSDAPTIALVGTGAFAQSMLLPAFRAEGGFSLWGVVSRDAVRGGNLARMEGAANVASSVSAALASPSPPDVVVIASRHDRHADEAAEALQAGRHAFVEKPLALTWDGLDRVAQAKAGSALLMVGYNRRFSPAARALKAALEKRRGPLLMTYRVNAGKIPREHWIQTVEGGGRNLGEACHIYDLFRALTGCQVAGVQAARIDPGGTDWLGNDNFSAMVTYDDGSLATLIYTAMGPKQGLGKERLEVFCDGEGYLLDDFVSLTRCSDGSVLWSGAVDKGHREEIRLFCDAVRQGGPSPIPFEELMETSALALAIEDMLMGRGGDL